ncbi:MAG TPA: hypothetical protein VJV79_14765 [Polyangiaceae bacterium]|nr:hypothetical protein [Polyangiaceae bacterium]
MATNTVQLQDLEEAEFAYNRVKAEVEALSATDLAVLNVDIVSATSIVLGVADRILTFRDRMVKLPEFEIRQIDNLVDYAKAAWYLYVTNLPVPEPGDAANLIEEVAKLRAKLLMWAAPLVFAGKFDESAIARIKEGSGNKDAPSDLVALVGLYRSKWEEVKSMCGVTEEDLTRGAQIGPAVFALISRREAKSATSTPEGSLRVRRAWTLLDRAYTQCRRALQFLRAEEGDADLIAPSLRKNSGTRASGGTTEPEPLPIASPQANVSPLVTAPPLATGPVVGAGSPFSPRP